MGCGSVRTDSYVSFQFCSLLDFHGHLILWGQKEVELKSRTASLRLGGTSRSFTFVSYDSLGLTERSLYPARVKLAGSLLLCARLDSYNDGLLPPLSCNRICHEKRCELVKWEKWAQESVFGAEKAEEECDRGWCHQRFRPRSDVRYFNWNIVPATVLFSSSPQNWSTRLEKEWIASNIFRTAPSKEKSRKIRCFVLFTRARHQELFPSSLELRIIRCKWWSSDDKDSRIVRGNDSSAVLACLAYKARTLDKRESTRSTDQHRKFYWGLV